MQCQKQITTIWTDRSAYLISSKRNGKEVQLEDVVKLDREDCSGEVYSREFRGLQKSSKTKELQINWGILQESFPYGTFKQETKGIDPVLPEWISNSWRNIEEEMLPERVFSGIASVKQYLLRVEAFCSPGSGLFFSFGGRGYFLGFSEGEIFSRISRDPAKRSGETMDLKEDWLHQTRMLYRNRTGSELKNLRLLDCGQMKMGSITDMPLIFEPISLGFLNCAGCRSLPDPIALIYTAIQEADVRNQLSFKILELRKNRIRMDSIFKWGACLLLLGWMTLLAGACHRTPPSDGDVKLMHEWRAAEANWHAGHKRWRESIEGIEKSRAEMLFIGSLGRSCPETIRIEQIQISRDRRTSDNLKLSFGGIIQGEQEQETFHQWLSGLMNEGLLAHVENLRFENKENALQFTVEGIIK